MGEFPGCRIVTDEREIDRQGKRKKMWTGLEEMHGDGMKPDRYGQSWKRCIEMERRWIGMRKEEKEGGQVHRDGRQEARE